MANLGGGPAVVVGDQSGHVDAYYLANGGQVPGWPFDAGSEINTSPSVAAVDASGLDTVYVGVGNITDNTEGGYQAISPTGADQWFVQETNPTTDTVAVHNGVMSSMAVGDLQGSTDVVAGSLGENEDAFDASSGALLPGFPWFQADSSFSTPALADLAGNGQTDIVEGYASSPGRAYDTTYTQGGAIRVVVPTGNAGQSWPNGGMACQWQSNQNIQSSPAVGDFLGSGTSVGIVTGTGTEFTGVSDTDQVVALTSSCQVAWRQTLDGPTTSSPALADVLGNGQLQVIESTGSSVWALNGSTGYATVAHGDQWWTWLGGHSGSHRLGIPGRARQYRQWTGGVGRDYRAGDSHAARWFRR